MDEHSAALVAFVLAAMCLVAAFVVGGLHLSPRVSSPLSGAATITVSTLLIVLASCLLVWGLLHLGYSHVV
jgi:hypothetical protein